MAPPTATPTLAPETASPMTNVPDAVNLTSAETPAPTEVLKGAALSEEKVESVKKTNTVAATGSLLSGSPGGITTGAKVAFLSNFGCQVEDIDLEEGQQLDWEFHPTIVAFGGGSSRYFRAASVMNPLVVLVALGILLGLAFIVKLLFGISWGRALGNVRSPGMVFIPFMFVIPGTSLVSSQLGLPPNFTDFFAVYGLLLLLVCVASPVLLYLLVCRHITARATAVPDPTLHVTQIDDPVKVMSGWRRHLYRFAFGDMIWVSKEEDGYFVEQYGVIFESYKEGKTWWVLVECSSVVAVGVLSSWQPGSPGECNVRNAIFTTVFGVCFLALIFVRPYLSMFDAALMGSVSGLMFVSVLLMTIGIGATLASTSWVYSTAAALLLITTILTFVKAVFDILAYGTDIWLGRKSGAREMHQQSVHQGEMCLPLSEVPMDNDSTLWLNGDVVASATLLPCSPGPDASHRSLSRASNLSDSTRTSDAPVSFGNYEPPPASSSSAPSRHASMPHLSAAPRENLYRPRTVSSLSRGSRLRMTYV
eukprot:TRINITY_DN3806_c0_g2_i3.p1 TRINITY_DN3806_c0_g2~~TRINITY_DN3806_c0_g2_i3.p1  ORF type:complete len:535 (+),score=194.58 TRINITY_DN3806_c0_g2_i3:1-1605(+)